MRGLSKNQNATTDCTFDLQVLYMFCTCSYDVLMCIFCTCFVQNNNAQTKDTCITHKKSKQHSGVSCSKLQKKSDALGIS